MVLTELVSLSSPLVLPPNPVKSCTSLGLLNDLNSLVASFRSCSPTCARCTLCRGGCSSRLGGAAALFKGNYHFNISECFGRMKDKTAFFFSFNGNSARVGSTRGALNTDQMYSRCPRLSLTKPGEFVLTLCGPAARQPGTGCLAPAV